MTERLNASPRLAGRFIGLRTPGEKSGRGVQRRHVKAFVASLAREPTAAERPGLPGFF